MNFRDESVTQALWYATVLWCGLLLGTSFAHALEMTPKLEMRPELWLQIQHSLYANFATAGAVAELGSIALAFALAVRLRESPSFPLAVSAVGALVLAFFAVWLGFTLPVNRQTAGWTADTMPSNWAALRRQWEYSHLVRFGLHLVGFGALAAVPLVSKRRRAVYTRPQLIVNANYTVLSDHAARRTSLRARRRSPS